MAFPKKPPQLVIENDDVEIAPHAKQAESVLNNVKSAQNKSIEKAGKGRPQNSEVNEPEEKKVIFTMRLNNDTHESLMKMATELTLEERKMISVQNVLERIAMDAVKKHEQKRKAS